MYSEMKEAVWTYAAIFNAHFTNTFALQFPILQITLASSIERGHSFE